LIDFKNKLDNREFWGENSKEMWETALEWQNKANDNNNIIKWSWNCGLKLDYDGDVFRISSRFYPPHKTSSEYGKYNGTISVVFGDDEYLHEHEIEAISLGDLKILTEEYVSDILKQMYNAIKLLL